MASPASDVLPSVGEASLFAAGVVVALGGLTDSPALTGVSSPGPVTGSDGSGAAALTGGVVSAADGDATGPDGSGEAAGASSAEVASAGVAGVSAVGVAGGASVAGVMAVGAPVSCCASGEAASALCASRWLWASCWLASGVVGSAAGLSTCSTASVGCWVSPDPNVTSGVCLRGRLANSSWVARSKAAAPRPKISIEIVSVIATNKERKPGSMSRFAPSRVSSDDNPLSTRLHYGADRRIKVCPEYSKGLACAPQKPPPQASRGRWREPRPAGDARRSRFAAICEL